MDKKILLVFAMEEESAGMFADFNVLHTGIGKVNAAYSLTKYLAHTRPDLVVNLGTAGSRKHAGGVVVNPRRFVQRDMDVTVLGVPKYQTPFSDDPIVLKHGDVVDGMVNGVCGSGDNFDASDAANDFDVVDMEAYALSLICHREDIRFLCLKYVSDGADGDANQDWNAALKRAAHALKEALEGANL